jgi:hypothetical protein
MQRISIVFFILLIMAGCSTSQVIEKEEIAQNSNYQDWRFLKAMVYYSNSEYERLQGNFETAFDLVRLAEENSPESVFLKEEIYNYLQKQARRDSVAADYIIKLGNKWYEDGYYNSKILYILAEACEYRNQIDLADMYYRTSLTEDAQRFQYLGYYHFQAEYFPPADSVYLGKAAAGEWKEDDQRIIYQVIDQYNTLGADERARELLLQAYRSWNELQSLLNIIALNVSLGDWNLTADLLAERQENEADLPAELLEYLISIYYETEKYDKVVELEAECRATGNELVMKMLFLSALQMGDYELSYRTADILISAGYIATDYYPSFYGSLWELEMKAGNWSKALEKFELIGEVLDKLGLVMEMMIDEANIEILDEFLENYYQVSEDKQGALFILTIFNLERGKWQRGEELLALVDNNYIQAEELVVALSAVYREHELGFLEEKLAENGLLSGMMYFYLKEYDKALIYLDGCYASGEIDVTGIIALATVLLENAEEERLLTVLENGRQLFPDNSQILNFYGYQIAVQEEEKLYAAAEKSLLQALENEPENAMYWDSLGWLYYRMGKMEPALEAMSHTIQVATRHAEIAYHFGAILFENSEFDQSLVYLLMVEDLEGGEELQDKVQVILDKIKIRD